MYNVGDEVKVKIDGKLLNAKITEKHDDGYIVKILTGKKGRPRNVDVVESQIKD
jgi:hypothetical protein